MIYAIKILETKIKHHNKMINHYENIECEITCDDIFALEEIKERKEYIRQLTESINLLKEKL